MSACDFERLKTIVDSLVGDYQPRKRKPFDPSDADDSAAFYNEAAKEFHSEPPSARFMVVASLAQFTDEGFWQGESLDGVQPAASEILGLFPPDVPIDRVPEYTLAWLMGWRRLSVSPNSEGWDGRPRKAYEEFERQIHTTISIVLDWMKTSKEVNGRQQGPKVPGLAALVGETDEAQFTTMIVDRLVHGKHLPCPCADDHRKRLCAMFPQIAEPWAREEAQDNHSRKVRNCDHKHSLNAWDPSKLTLWAFLRQAVRNGYRAVKSGELTSGMFFPILREKYSLDEALVVVRICPVCAKQAAAHNEKAPIALQIGEPFSYTLDRCQRCSHAFSKESLPTTKRLLILTKAGGFNERMVWSCKKCTKQDREPAVFFAQLCIEKRPNHDPQKIDHDCCPICGTIHSDGRFWNRSKAWYHLETEPASQTSVKEITSAGAEYYSVSEVQDIGEDIIAIAEREGEIPGWALLIAEKINERTRVESLSKKRPFSLLLKYECLPGDTVQLLEEIRDLSNAPRTPQQLVEQWLIWGEELRGVWKDIQKLENDGVVSNKAQTKEWERERSEQSNTETES